MMLEPNGMVRSLRAGEAMLHRELRLRALRDAPEQFCEALEEALARSREGWDALTAAVVPPSTQAMFIAQVSGSPVGSVYALDDVETPDVGRVGGMWVAPGQRRRGVGTALLGAVHDWARRSGKRSLRLWVACDGDAARRLYEHAGFRLTGARKAFPGSPGREIVEMERAV